MKNSLALHFRLYPLIALLLCAYAPLVQSAPVPARYTRGTIHGLLELRSDDGKVVASGDLVQVARGGQITGQVTFHFKDGSIDDETTVYSQHGVLKLISDHHVQKGPSFPQPLDLYIDCIANKVTVRSTGKDGKEDVKVKSMKLPPDLANGLVSAIVENVRPAATETRVPLLVAAPMLRLVTLVVAPHGEDSFSVGGAARKALHYEIKIELGGIVGMVAPMIGKQPPNIQIWVVGGQAPTFVREQGQLYADSPVYTIELAGPTWPDASHPAN